MQRSGQFGSWKQAKWGDNLSSLCYHFLRTRLCREADASDLQNKRGGYFAKVVFDLFKDMIM